MTPIKILIVDDEAPARTQLARYLKLDGRFNLVGMAADGEEAINLICQKNPELVLMDVQMPGISGFDVLRLIDAEQRPAVIFTTAFDEYAIKAFEVSAIDYLLKPFGRKRLEQALNKFLYRCVNAQHHLTHFLGELEFSETIQRLPLRTHNRVRVVEVEKIHYFLSEHRLINVYTRCGERLWTGETLDNLQKRLDPKQFFRIHRSSMINLKAEFELESMDSGRLKVILPDDRILVVARDRAKLLKQILGM